MKSILLLTLFLFASPTETKVYICTGSMSECYHKTKECKGIKNCSRVIKEITLKEAKDLGRRPCGYFYKRK